MAKKKNIIHVGIITPLCGTNVSLALGNSMRTDFTIKQIMGWMKPNDVLCKKCETIQRNRENWKPTKSKATKNLIYR